MARFRSRRRRLPLFTLGAGLMYLLDPDNGKHRRALLRDKVLHFARVGRESANRAKRDLANRAHGFLVSHDARKDDNVPDEVLVEQVRSQMGVFVSHPHAVEVHAEQGVVTLKGPILRREAQPFTRRVRHMAGVHELVDRLDRHGPDDNVSALQGGVARNRRPEFLQANWAPGPRVLAGAAGLALFASGRARRNRPVAALGAALLLRTLANMPLKSVFRVLRRDMFAKRGAGAGQLPSASPGKTTLPVSEPTLQVSEPTPIEQAEEVARSIRE